MYFCDHARKSRMTLDTSPFLQAQKYAPFPMQAANGQTTSKLSCIEETFASKAGDISCVDCSGTAPPLMSTEARTLDSFTLFPAPPPFAQRNNFLKAPVSLLHSVRARVPRQAQLFSRAQRGKQIAPSLPQQRLLQRHSLLAKNWRAIARLADHMALGFL